MTWAIVVGMVGLLVGSTVAAKQVLDGAPMRAPADGDPDAARDAIALGELPGCVRTTAVVTALRQTGANRGVVRHRCRVELLVDLPSRVPGAPAAGAATGSAVPVTIEADLGTEQLAWWLPGSVVDVAVDLAAEPADDRSGDVTSGTASGTARGITSGITSGIATDGRTVRVCRPMFVATRARATGRAALPATSVKGTPKAVFVHPSARDLPPGARRTTAVVGSIDVSEPVGSTCAVTLGLWVDDSYATTVSDRLRLDEVVALARGATVPVSVDAAHPLVVAVDVAGATAALAARLADARAMQRAVAELGLPGRVGVVQSVESGDATGGVRHEFVAVVAPVMPVAAVPPADAPTTDAPMADAPMAAVRVTAADDGGRDAPRAATVRMVCAVTDAAPLVCGSAVVLDATTHRIDLESTDRARVQAALERRRGAPVREERVMAAEAVPDETYEALADELTQDQRTQLWALVQRLRRRGPDAELGDDVHELHDLVYRCGLVMPFDTGSSMEDGAFGRRRLMRHLSVADAVRYVTAVIRGERFCPGGLAEAVEDGSLLDAIEVVLGADGGTRSLAS